MKKIRTLLVIFIVGLFLFLGINSNATMTSEETVSPLTTNPTRFSTITLVTDKTAISDGTSFYSEPFKCSQDYAYAQVYISTIKGNSLWFTLQKYDGTKWLPEDVVNSANTIFANDDLKTDIYLMFCGKDKTNYVTPDGVTTKKVLSVSTSDNSNAILANQLYRIVVHNKKQWNGKTAYVNATLKVKNL
ncbi:MAG: hypothetical protein NC310_02285 [Roseburia sp.]|nr:hypothetical protein [Anaeroplasma bactoclasticum]MCM1195884.1 hypothetical protein [Roseburia sp.]MCM1556229.1 hypothetical protein [Anaeroplasma bactoclasticum]